ncbi:MAG: MFS transporter [Deltaproteobacteria bacterium]|nr:MFS transporter [Deltaproteobacteria bacterium]
MGAAETGPGREGSGDPRPTADSGWSPLARPIFRALWIANVASMVGTWMHDVGAGWLMTSLAPDPFMVSLVQAATTLPVFLLALPSGALADIFDRRRLLLITHVWSSATAAALGFLTIFGVTSAGGLLALTFVLGLALALTAPAWLAVISELVPPPEVPAAVTLNGVALNVSRAVGPALGGLVIAAAGTGWVFLLNGASYLGVIAVLLRWKRPKVESTLPAERLVGAVRAGVRYVRHAPALRAVLLRAAGFIVPASAFWALLPLLARAELGRGPGGYGGLVATVGLGAVVGGAVLPGLRWHDRSGWLVPAAWSHFGPAILTVAHGRASLPVATALGLAGVAWISLLSSLNASAQVAVPAWVRGRALAVYLLVFFGGMAVGSAFWGNVARVTSIPAALDVAGAALVAGGLVAVRFRLPTLREDLTPSMHWRQTQQIPEALLERGPVVVSVEYRIDPASLADFTAAMGDLRRIRLRDGAIRWELYSDPEGEGTYLETFVVESWLEHLRQHERVTVADKSIQERCSRFHVGERPQRVTHFLAEPVPHRRARR